METCSTKRHRRSCIHICLLSAISVMGGISRWWQPNKEFIKEADELPQLLEERYVHVPVHAGSSFMKTTTTREVLRANEIL